MNNKNIISRLERKSCELRNLTLYMCIKAGTGHVTSSMSCAEIMAVLYNYTMRKNPSDPEWDDRDRFVLSKGQASPILYSTLADSGYFSKNWLNTFNQKNGKFGVHLQGDVPGVEFTTGSLGHGLGYGIGTALAAKMKQKDYHTFVLLGDAELQEGSCWESIMFASQLKLNNLTGIIDRNGYGVLCPTEKAVALEPLEDRFESFGWDIKRINGHSINELLNSFNLKERRNKPLMIIADTIKGKGIKSWENVALKHGMAPKDDAEKTIEELANVSPCDLKRCGIHDALDLDKWKCFYKGKNGK